MKKPLKPLRPTQAEGAYPSPAEVERMCQEIQSNWSDCERRRRTVVTSGNWSAPTIKVAEISREKTPHWTLSFS